MDGNAVHGQDDTDENNSKERKTGLLGHINDQEDKKNSEGDADRVQDDRDNSEGDQRSKETNNANQKFRPMPAKRSFIAENVRIPAARKPRRTITEADLDQLENDSKDLKRLQVKLAELQVDNEELRSEKDRAIDAAIKWEKCSNHNKTEAHKFLERSEANQKTYVELCKSRIELQESNNKFLSENILLKNNLETLLTTLSGVKNENECLKQEAEKKISEIEILKIAYSTISEDYKDADKTIEEQKIRISQLMEENDNLSKTAALAFQVEYDGELARQSNNHSQFQKERHPSNDRPASNHSSQYGAPFMNLFNKEIAHPSTNQPCYPICDEATGRTWYLPKKRRELPEKFWFGGDMEVDEKGR